MSRSYWIRLAFIATAVFLWALLLVQNIFLPIHTVVPSAYHVQSPSRVNAHKFGLATVDDDNSRTLNTAAPPRGHAYPSSWVVTNRVAAGPCAIPQESHLASDSMFDVARELSGAICPDVRIAASDNASHHEPQLLKRRWNASISWPSVSIERVDGKCKDMGKLLVANHLASLTRVCGEEFAGISSQDFVASGSQSASQRLEFERSSPKSSISTCPPPGFSCRRLLEFFSPSASCILASHSRSATASRTCDLKRIGHIRDGGWTTCGSLALSPKEINFTGSRYDNQILPLWGPCMVVSIGLEYDWSFDQDALSRGCIVVAMDPTLFKFPAHVQLSRTVLNSCNANGNCTCSECSLWDVARRMGSSANRIDLIDNSYLHPFSRTSALFFYPLGIHGSRRFINVKLKGHGLEPWRYLAPPIKAPSKDVPLVTFLDVIYGVSQLQAAHNSLRSPSPSPCAGACRADLIHGLPAQTSMECVHCLQENTRIDTLKIDCEGAEWASMGAALKVGLFRTVGVLLIEFHTLLDGQTIPISDMWTLFSMLETEGFVAVYAGNNSACRRTVTVTCTANPWRSGPSIRRPSLRQTSPSQCQIPFLCREMTFVRARNGAQS